MKKIKEIDYKKVILLVIFLATAILLVLSGRNTNIGYLKIDSNIVTEQTYNNTLYSAVSKDWSYVYDVPSILVVPDQISSDLISGDQYGYTSDVVRLSEGENLSFNVNVSVAGAYNIMIDQYDDSDNVLPNEISVMINGIYEYDESKVIKLPTFWQFATANFQLDRYGNEILPNSVKVRNWDETTLVDSTGLNKDPLKFYFVAGDNTVTISSVSGEILLGNVSITSKTTTPSYEEYLTENPSSMGAGDLVIGAEDIYQKTNPSIRLSSERDPSATSYNTQYLRLNTLDGNSFRTGNDEIVYQVNVTKTGYYYIGFKYRQTYIMQMPVFREVRIDGTVPFKEVSCYPFAFSNNYQNTILNNNNENFKFYLTAGTHTISLRVVLEPYRNAYENIIGVMDQITNLSLEIKKLTGNTSDKYRTWKLIDYIPDIETRFDKWIATLTEIDNDLATYSHQTNPGQLTNLKLAISNLTELRKDVDKIPNKMVMLADGSSSASQFLGTTIQNFLQNGLDIEKIYVNTDTKLPSAKANVFVRSFESVKRFFLSFISNEYSATKKAGPNEIEVWVNHPRQYIEIMQAMIDNDFTPNTGIKVKLSIMPDQNKLILSNAAGISPDVALGVDYWIPYEFAIRGASLDLRQFSGYGETVKDFAPGVMVPYVFEDGMFGLPETQNFWVTFYRSDIMNALNLPVPDTWDEVIQILPELQRYGMNFYEPLALFKGFKPFVATIPFIYQFDGTLIADNGMSTVINSDKSLEGMKLMTDLFTVYNLPKEVPNFYNHFRYGTLPIGISDLATYLQLTIAAPEIAGKWDIAPHPGVKNSQGVVQRWAASGAQASMILEKTKHPQESWDFLSWWMSTNIQTTFAQRLQTTYGTAYLWNTANLNAFANLPLPSKDKQVILDQWKFALEASRIPGSYMIEREISNAWNKIVFDDANPRVTLDEAVKTANREILYKMEEFGYVKNGVIVKDYKVPTIENIDYWLKERG